MSLTLWGRRLALSGALIALTLACRTSDILVAQSQPTPTRARATFTPQPPTPTPTPPPTATRTRQPTARPTARPPTAVPPPVAPPPPAATTPPFKYKVVNKGCEHSGQTFIQGTVYHGTERVAGVRVVMSADPDGGVVDQKMSGDDGDGFFSLIVNAFGASPGQKRSIWIVEDSRRVSEIATFEFNNLKPEQPGVCWRGFADFQLW